MVLEPQGHFCGDLKLVIQDRHDSRVVSSRQFGVHRAWCLSQSITEKEGGWFLVMGWWPADVGNTVARLHSGDEDPQRLPPTWHMIPRGS